MCVCACACSTAVAQAVAGFLRDHMDALDKSALGEYFGAHEAFEVAAMHAFIDQVRGPLAWRARREPASLCLFATTAIAAAAAASMVSP